MAHVSTTSATAGDVYQLFRGGVRQTRASLIESTGLARATLGARLDELMAGGLVGSAGDGDSSGGRPPRLFAWRPAARVVAGIDFGASHATAVVTDLAGSILAREKASRSIASGPESSIRWLGDRVRAMLADLGRGTSDLLAVGAGLPGPVEWPAGRPVTPPLMPGWDGVDVPAAIDAELGVPAAVDNDVNVMALGEHAVGWPDVQDLLFLKVATGIGSGIIAGGALHRGADGIAGDIGHVRVARGAGVRCSCGDEGCLEAIASGSAVARALTAAGLEAEDGRDVVRLVRAGDERAHAAVRRAGNDIGEVLAAGIRFLNPSVIVLGGSLSLATEPLLAGIDEVLDARSTPIAARRPPVAHTRAGDDAAALGASRLAIDIALTPRRVDALLTP